jgi:hypothetical protein
MCTSLHCAQSILKSMKVSAYPADLEPSFVDEFVQFTSIVTADDNTIVHMSQLLSVDRGNTLLPSFPNVGIGLRMYLTIPVNNCEGERSFSTLSRVKNRLRSTMGQPRLNALALLSIESDIMRDLDFTELIDTFATAKSRRRDI